MTIYLAEYSSFSSVQELNYHVKHHTNLHKYDMNETQRKLLQFLSQYSVKFLGASHLKTDTIANGLRKSKRTIERSINVLERLGVIERINTVRSRSGGKGANIYRILPHNDVSKVSHCSNNEILTQTSDVTHEKQKETANPIKRNNTIQDTNIPVESLRGTMPTVIFNTLSAFFNVNELYRIYGILLRAKANVNRHIRIENNSQLFIDAFLRVIRKYKAGGVRNLSGYLYVAWQKATRKAIWLSIAEMY
ncbi:helix-turn-helix domain-containing protein [Thalassobacillus pellis]|uniref:helix-turn-helix domain-containing protein n=1 Tax=Thalassobacillus pellis TaxID=748008 RepID=UPI00195F481E|nr:hypothetical protein [Thalassobacillus pellis]MBM7554904.1 putative transcriptional regulator [Thalassobacillus pellis]